MSIVIGTLILAAVANLAMFPVSGILITFLLVVMAGFFVVVDLLVEHDLREQVREQEDEDEWEARQEQYDADAREMWHQHVQQQEVLRQEKESYHFHMYDIPQDVEYLIDGFGTLYQYEELTDGYGWFCTVMDFETVKMVYGRFVDPDGGILEPKWLTPRPVEHHLDYSV